MRSDNLKTVRRLFSAWNEGLEEHMAFYADDAVHHTAPDWPEQGTYHGKAEIHRLWEYILSDYPGSQVQPVELWEADSERVLSALRWTFQGPSGVPGNLDAFALWTLSDGLVVRVEYFIDEDEARRASGLPSPRDDGC